MDNSRIPISNPYESVSESIESEATPVSFTLNTTESKHFNRIGFSCVTMWPTSADTKFEELLKDHEGEQKLQLEFIEQHYQLDITRFDDKVEYLKTQFAALQGYLTQLQTGTTDNINKKETLISKIQELKEEIYALYNDFGNEKHQLIETRIKAIQLELKHITENYAELTKQRNTALSKVYEQGKYPSQVKLDTFKEHAAAYKQRLEAIQKKVALLNEAQVADTATLKGVLLFSNVASGVFFAMFAVAANLNSETIFFFIISAILKFGETLTHQYGIIRAFGLMLVGCVLILLLILGFAWLCKLMLPDIKKSDTTSKIDFESNGDATSLKTQLSANNVFDFLLQVAPAVLILSIFFILLVVGNAAQNINKLDMALSGLAAGMAITIILGAIAFVYISKVIEPRFEKQTETNFSRFRANIELFLLIGLFLIIFLLLLLGIDKLTLFGNRLLPLLLFVITALPTAIATAYGVWYDGILRTLTHLERKSKELADAIKDNSRARDESFPKKFFELESELWGLVISKTKMAQKFLDTNPSIPSATENKLDVASLKLSSDEALYFPHVENTLKTLQTELQSKRKALKKLNKKINESLNRDVNEKRQLMDNIEKIYNKISNYQREMVKCRNKWVETRNAQIEKGQKERLALIDGFKLGKWYLEQLPISKKDTPVSQDTTIEKDIALPHSVAESGVLSSQNQNPLENDITLSQNP